MDTLLSSRGGGADASVMDKFDVNGVNGVNGAINGGAAGVNGVNGYSNSFSHHNSNAYGSHGSYPPHSQPLHPNVAASQQQPHPHQPQSTPPHQPHTPSGLPSDISNGVSHKYPTTNGWGNHHHQSMATPTNSAPSSYSCHGAALSASAAAVASSPRCPSVGSMGGAPIAGGSDYSTYQPPGATGAPGTPNENDFVKMTVCADTYGGQIPTHIGQASHPYAHSQHQSQQQGQQGQPQPQQTQQHPSQQQQPQQQPPVQGHSNRWSPHPNHTPPHGGGHSPVLGSSYSSPQNQGPIGLSHDGFSSQGHPAISSTHQDLPNNHSPIHSISSSQCNYNGGHQQSAGPPTPFYPWMSLAGEFLWG